MQNACLNGDYAAALKVQDRLMPLHTSLFVETNPDAREICRVRCSA